MFANVFQSGFISIFYSVGSNPLSLWDKSVKNGHIRRLIDEEVKSLVLEVSGTNVATTYITCPIKPRASLGIKLPFLVMVIKNMKKYFTFEIQILDDKDMHRRFRVSNFQSTTKVRPFCTTMPIGLSSGWNQIQFNLADFTRRAYGSTYLETMRVQIHANIRVRRVYFSDRLYGDDEMPHEFKLFLPIPGTHRRQPKPKHEPKKEGAAGKQAESKGITGEGVPPEDISQTEEQEIPSGAPPTPVTVTEPARDEEEGPGPPEAHPVGDASPPPESESAPEEKAEGAATEPHAGASSAEELRTISEESPENAPPSAEEPPSEPKAENAEAAA